jgi:MHS family citrate/tricarballylate:H+ symporter-like MFS transporter
MQPHVSADTPSAHPLIRGVIRVIAGNFLEQFDFFLFGFYATHIAAAFFPSSSDFAGLMKTFAVFGAGFLMRPLGAVVLGAYIDEVGRRKGLILTLSLMACGTILIAFVPGYATIGLFAPLLVLIGRLLQGFSAGAEIGGVSVYLAEMAPPNRKGFFTAWQSGSQQVSIVLAAVLGFGLNKWMDAPTIADWGWRIPFMVGCLIIPFIFVLRQKLQETEEFKARKHRPTLGEASRSLMENWKLMLGGALLVAMTTTTFYLITVYAPTFGASVLHLSTSDSLIVTMCVGISNFIWLPLGGALTDKIGRRPLLLTMTVLAILTAYPSLSYLANGPTFLKMLFVLLWLSFLFGMYNGAMVVALTEVMPASVRVAGFSVAYSLATAIFGGFTPAISTELIHLTGDHAAPGFWMTFSAICGLCATLGFYRKGGRGVVVKPA